MTKCCGGSLRKAQKRSHKYAVNKGRWREEEHQIFLESLKGVGKNWRDIAAILQTRTAIQVRSHAQKFFMKMVRDKTEVEDCEVSMTKEYASVKKGTAILVSCVASVHSRNLEYEVLMPESYPVSRATVVKSVKAVDGAVKVENVESRQSKGGSLSRCDSGSSCAGFEMKKEDTAGEISDSATTCEQWPVEYKSTSDMDDWMLLQNNQEESAYENAAYQPQMLEMLDWLLNESQEEL